MKLGRLIFRLRVSLGQHHDLPTRFVLFHAAMCLNDLVEVERFADLDAQCARCDLFDQILDRCPHEIFRFAGICGQAHRSGNRFHWSEIVEGPFVADNTSHADDAPLFGATQRVFERSCADQFEHFVDAFRTDFLDLFCNRTSIDEYLIDPACPQKFFAVRTTSCCSDEGAVVFGNCRGRPTDVVPPRTSSRSPFSRRSDLNSEPHAVCSISGMAPSVSQGSSVLMACTCFAGTEVYSA